PLRYQDEFVRHKILDIIGDLALVGRPIRGHVVAVKPSHTSNCELARMISAQMRRPLVAMQTFTPPPEKRPGEADAQAIIQSVQEGGSLDINQLMKILPHRYPFLMIDRVLKIDGNKITGLKNVSSVVPY